MVSSENNDQRMEKRRQRERQYKIDRVIAQYVDAYHSGQSPRIEDYVERYPQYTSELLEFAVYYHTIGFATESLQGPPDPELSPAAEKALARIREQRAAYAAAPEAQMTPSPVAPIESLVRQGIRHGYAPPELAEAVGLSDDLLARLEARKITLTTIPRLLFERLAATLNVTAEAIRAYLSAPQPGQTGGFFYADQQPAEEHESFLDAVQASTLSPERKREWAEIVNAETTTSE